MAITLHFAKLLQNLFLSCLIVIRPSDYIISFIRNKSKSFGQVAVNTWIRSIIKGP